MALYFQKTYRPALEQRLRQDAQSLAEKACRRFAALEAIKRGHGGIRSLAPGLGCDPHPVNDGRRELRTCPMLLRDVASASLEADAKRRQANTRT